ncbi:Proteasome subunit alpha type-5 [Linum perenne]
MAGTTTNIFNEAGINHITKPSFAFQPPDPLCNLNLKETSDFVKSFPFAGNPASAAVNRKNFPSKWDDAQKWLVASPAHPLHHRPPPRKQSCTEKVISASSPANDSDLLPKDKFTDDVETMFPKLKNAEGFLFRNMKADDATVEHRDVGTEMTPLGSSTTSRCHTPFSISSPARHNTPANRSGPLAPTSNSESSNSSSRLMLDISQLQDCHLAKLQLDPVGSNWSSKEDEEEEVSKSLRHFEMGRSSSVSDGRAAAALAWEEEEKTKWCLRYEREEARIEAWVKLQSAKAEAQSRKLEVKIQKMRSSLEEKLMKRMAIVRRRAEEQRAAALQQHAQHIHITAQQARKMITTAAAATNPNTPPAGVGAGAVTNETTSSSSSSATTTTAAKAKYSNQFSSVSQKEVFHYHSVVVDPAPAVGETCFSQGRLFQVEYAIEAIKLGSTAIGLKTKEGVVLAVEKRITSPLLEPSSVEKIMEIDQHIGCAMSGLIADARTLVEHARVETQSHRFSYGEPMTVESTTQALCDLALRFGEGDEESMSRPFGVSLLIAGHDENGPSLYYTDPSGTFWQCNAKAIGSGSEGADSSLQEQYNKDLTLLEAETIALSILKQVMEEKVTPNNVDIAKVSPTYHLYTPAEVEAVIGRL